MMRHPWVSGGLCLALYLTHAAALGDHASLSARFLGKGKFATGNTLLTQTVPSVLACLDLCRGFTLCVGFSYNGVSCELRDTASILSASTGWVTYLITQQPDLPLLVRINALFI
ncbi:uncharacterized protein LOC108673298 [Hyalella azteca]|uniref:Uncharacterized protein LOC108673298 n=1 Tax=Hyalella azteca TaxID=294128 RepID=A0A979FUT9_HYAAZ|nr:uncharacterized protein LOC108673298 [Hyalella azteca]